MGAGPSGATAALLLGHFDIPTLVISRHRGTANTPRAHIFNQRAMEALRDAGIEHLVMPIAAAKEDLAHVAWLRSLNGEEYGRVYAWGNKPDRMGEYVTASPCQMSDLPQSVLEPILVQEATKLGASFRFSTEFVAQKELPDGRVRTTVRDRATNATYNIVSQYLIGADGARSPVLDSLDIPIDGDQLGIAFNVHVKADLTRYFAHRPGSMNWLLNPDAPDWSATASVRMVRPWNEFIVSMHAARHIEEFNPTDEQILQRLHQLFGDETIPIELLGHYQWHINEQVARRWQKGRVLCIGDAVHRHPPINGLGSNTCISDAFNLAWKLAYVLKGQASPSILGSLTPERKPVGDGIVRRANAGLRVHQKLWDLMATDAKQSAQVRSVMREASARGQEMRRKVRGLMEQTDDEFNALGIQMNQMYVDSPLTVVEAEDVAPDLTGVNLMKQEVRSTYPGFHLPHVWLARDGQSERVSTLDLAGKGSFAFFTGIGGERWKQAAEEIANEGGVVVNAYSVGIGQDYMDAYWDWQDIRGVDEDGVVLVRPDQFVCWRCRQMPSDPKARLREVLQNILWGS